VIKAVIFDMDDLMIDSHSFHKEILENILQSYGVSLFSKSNPLTVKEESNFIGRRLNDVFELLIKKYSLKATPEEMNSEFKRQILAASERDAVPMPGLFSLIGLIKPHYKLAVASSGTREKIHAALKNLKLTGDFGIVVSGDEVANGKPAPDVFLKAAEKLAVKPAECLVLEDAEHGVQAAKAAGMRCIGVHNQTIFKALGVKQDLSKADLQVSSLQDIGLETIRGLND
jgi:HAD superfamily hydrolase (TIGR01509 family)